ncbi:hypothetical protein BC831DRAFT_508880 [Entophlyctis helioformis]|nr:hypothetical protein BC831DRAFT_508880 [Entophlyctis helioformis]
MALYLKDVWFDSALLPFPEDAAFDYNALCELANDISLLPPAAGPSASSTAAHQPPQHRVVAPLTLDTWTALAARRLGLSPAQALVYYETFALLLRPLAPPAPPAPAAVPGHGSAPDAPASASTQQASVSDPATTAATIARPTHTQASTATTATATATATAATPHSGSHAASLPSVHFLLLLFNQLHRRPFVRDQILKGDEYPRRIHHAHHPLGHLHHRRPLFSKRSASSDEWDVLVGGGGGTPGESAASVSTPIVTVTHSPSTATPGVQHAGLPSTSASSSLSSSSSSSLSSSLDQPHATFLGLHAFPPTHGTTSLATAAAATAAAAARFPTHVTEGRHHLASYWRSSGKRWLHLIYIAYNGRQIDKAHATADGEHAASAATSPNMASGHGAQLPRHGLAETLELDIDWLSIFDFLFTAICTPHASLRAKLKQLFVDWVLNDRDVELDLEDVDAFVNQHASPSTQASPHPTVFATEPAMDVFTDFCSGLPAFAGKAVQSVPIDLINQWIVWAVMERPLSLRLLKMSENGVVYGYEDTRSWFHDEKATPQVLISRKRNQFVVAHAAYIYGANVFIHRCHDAHIYIMGPVRSLSVSRCRNTTITVGAVAKDLTIVQCERLTVSAVCGQLRVSSSSVGPSLELQPGSSAGAFGGPGSDSIVAYVHTTARPIVSCGSGDSGNGVPMCSTSSASSNSGGVGTGGEDQEMPSVHGELDSAGLRGVVLAPCNAFYDGMLDDVRAAGLDLQTPNQWDQVVGAWDRVRPSSSCSVATMDNAFHGPVAPYAASAGPVLGVAGLDTPNHAAGTPVSLLPPSMFFLSPVPFDRVSPSPAQLSLALASAHLAGHSASVPMDVEMQDDQRATLPAATRSALSPLFKHAPTARADSAATLNEIIDDVEQPSTVSAATPSALSKLSMETLSTAIKAAHNTSTSTSTSTSASAADSLADHHAVARARGPPQPERDAVMACLPDAYRAWLLSLDPLVAKARSIMESVTAPADVRQRFQAMVESEFQAWLKKTGRVSHLVGLLGVDRDMDRLHRAWPSAVVGASASASVGTGGNAGGRFDKSESEDAGLMADRGDGGDRGSGRVGGALTPSQMAV